MRRFWRWFFETLVGLYYPVRVVENGAAVPSGRPLIFVINHPNALLDPLVLRTALRRPIGFLAKSTMFENPIGRFAMGVFAAIPVYRRADGGNSDVSRNDETFARCRAALGRGEALALFPEGTSHSSPQLKPLKTGAARIALSAVAEHQGHLPLAIVPVGLLYEEKTTFRSRTHVKVGTVIEVNEFTSLYASEPDAAVHALTEAIRQRLDEVVLQAETRELLNGVAHVASWTAGSKAGAEDLADHERRARELLTAYQALRAVDPTLVDKVAASARRYMRILKALGIDDPWALEIERLGLLRSLRAVGKLLGLLPFAVVGTLLFYAPYRLAGEVAPRFAREDDVLGTVKLLAGTLFVLFVWFVEISVAFAWLGLAAALAVLLLAPLCGYAAVRFGEQWVLVREGARYLFIRTRHRDLTQALGEHRHELAKTVSEALSIAASKVRSA